MNILLVNTSERVGGAAIASHRLMRALNRNGVKAMMLVRDKQTDDPHVVRLPQSPMLRLKFVAERAEIYASNHFRRENLWSVDTATHGTDITRLPEFRRADLIHLNWVNQGMLSVGDVAKILKSGKPVVWTMHDMWPFTGICHHAENCEGWLHGCGNCPKVYAPSEHDFSQKTFLRKQAAYAKGRLTMVACSNWLAGLARKAPLLEGHSVVSIPNAIDTRFYVPGDKLAARRELGLPEDQKLLLFVAYKATDLGKGINYLIEATEHIVRDHPDWRRQLGIVPVGRESETLKDAFACDAWPQGIVTDAARMRLLYQAADLFVIPTLMDNLPNTIVEAMSCGLPCVGFNVGGLPQMIQDGINGYLVLYRNAAELARLSLAALVSNRYDSFCEYAHRTAVENYSESVVAARYKRLYEECLGETGRN